MRQLLLTLAIFVSAGGSACGRCPAVTQPPKGCATEKIPDFPKIRPEDLAGPEDGCPEKFEVCLDAATAAKIDRYHEQLRRAAEVNARLCAPSVGGGSR